MMFILMRDNKWVRLLAYVTGLVNQRLILQNECLLAENHILRLHIPARLRLSNGFAILASCTFGKLISDSAIVPSHFGAVEVGSDNGYQNGKYDRRAERSLDPTGVSNRLVISGIYELPVGKGKPWSASNGFGNALSGGWQLNVIGTLQGGLPPVVRAANNFLANRPNSTGKSAKLDDRTPERWLDTNAFVNPPNFTFGTLAAPCPTSAARASSTSTCRRSRIPRSWNGFACSSEPSCSTS